MIQFSITHNLMLLLASLLGLLVVIGFSLFSIGLVQSKNTVDVMCKNMVLWALTILVFMLSGWHIAMSDKVAFMYFPAFHWHMQPPQDSFGQFMYLILGAGIIVTLITAMTVERIKLWPLLVYSIFMVGFIYPVVIFWVWGDGLLHHAGFVDFAGAGVFQLTAVAAGIAALIHIGKRKGRFVDGKSRLVPGANLPFAALGAWLIWLGFFGLALGGILLQEPNTPTIDLIKSVVNVAVGAASGLLVALVLARVLYGKTDLTLVLNGLLAGLVALTAAPAAQSILMAVFIGAVAGILVIIANSICGKLRIDDPVGVIASCGVGSVWGLLVVSNHGHIAWYDQLVTQLLGIVIIFAWVLISSFIIFSVIRFTIGLRIRPDDETQGLDRIDYGMQAYPEFTKTQTR